MRTIEKELLALIKVSPGITKSVLCSNMTERHHLASLVKQGYVREVKVDHRSAKLYFDSPRSRFAKDKLLDASEYNIESDCFVGDRADENETLFLIWNGSAS